MALIVRLPFTARRASERVRCPDPRPDRCAAVSHEKETPVAPVDGVEEPPVFHEE